MKARTFIRVFSSVLDLFISSFIVCPAEPAPIIIALLKCGFFSIALYFPCINIFLANLRATVPVYWIKNPKIKYDTGILINNKFMPII